MTESVNWYVDERDVGQGGLPTLSDAIPLNDNLLQFAVLSGPDANFFTVQFGKRSTVIETTLAQRFFDYSYGLDHGSNRKTVTDDSALLVWTDAASGFSLEHPSDAGHDGVFNVTITLFNWYLPVVFDVAIQVVPNPPSPGPRLASSQSATVAENTVGDIVPEGAYLPVQFNDPDRGTVTEVGFPVWTISDPQTFNINPNTGFVWFKQAPDFETFPHEVHVVRTVKYTGQTENGQVTYSLTQDLTIGVTDVAEPPTLDLVSGDFLFQENDINATAQPIAAGATVTSQGNHWAGGHLSVTGLLAEDRVSILDAWPISVNGDSVATKACRSRRRLAVSARH